MVEALNSFSTRVVKVLKEPSSFSFKVWGKLFPRRYWQRVSDLARVQGLTKTHFILSFDCDTEQDIAVVERLNLRLRELGICPVFVVPGELLLHGRDVYRNIAATGGEFLNHGYKIHTVFNPTIGSYKSTYFYDSRDLAAVRRDIERGHESYVEVLGKEPLGFRTPHFGTFQKREEIDFIHRTLSRLGYQFSSSTVPLAAFKGGPLVRGTQGVVEIPLTGCFHYPHLLLDSWAFRNAPDRRFPEGQYLEEVEALIDFFDGGTKPGLINLYVDPGPVAEWDIFFQAMKRLAPLNTGSYAGLLTSQGLH